jgi:steroid delta-isomerase-like uncharacterized protein
VSENTDLVQRFIDEIFVAGQTDAVADLVTDDFVSHGLPGSGPRVMTAAIERVSGALSGVTFQIEDTISQDDKVAVRLTSSAIQSGTFMGMPPTDKRYTIEEIHIFRIEAGKVAEHWHQMDAMGMLQQLGQMPTPGGGS